MEDIIRRPASTEAKSKQRRPKWSITRLLTLACLILLTTTLFFGWKYSQSRKEIKRLQDPQYAVNLQADQLKAKVAKLVDVPDERPVVETVNDASALKTQAFFAKAENGDKVLIFQKANRILLYRPSTNKVIAYQTANIAPSQ